MSESPKPMYGVWSLTRPDGKAYLGQNPLQCVSIEQRERIPPEVALERILEAAKPTPDEIDAARYRFCVDNNMVLSGGAVSFGWPIAPVGKQWNKYIDSAMAAQKQTK